MERLLRAISFVFILSNTGRSPPSKAKCSILEQSEQSKASSPDSAVVPLSTIGQALLISVGNPRGGDSQLQGHIPWRWQFGLQPPCRPKLRFISPSFFAPIPKVPACVSCYVSHVGTSWTLTFSSPITTLVVDFCPHAVDFPVHLQGGGMRGSPSIPTIHCLIASRMSSLVPHCFELGRFANPEKDFPIRSSQISVGLHYAVGFHPRLGV